MDHFFAALWSVMKEQKRLLFFTIALWLLLLGALMFLTTGSVVSPFVRNLF